MPYRRVVERFLAEGLIEYFKGPGEQSNFCELVLEYKTLTELIEIAEQLGIDAAGSKRQLVERILQKDGERAFWDVSVANQLFIRTEKGTEEGNCFDHNCLALQKGIEKRVFAALCLGDFRTALRLHKSFHMHTQNRWWLEAEEANEVVRLIQSKNNIYQMTEGEFAQLKAFMALQALWSDLQLRDWIRFPITLKTSGAEVGEDLLKEAFQWDMTESEVLENLDCPE